MTAKASLPAGSGQAEGGGELVGSAHLKPTSMAGLCLSWYSTSASARAEPQSKHQLTGLRPLKTQPRLTISASARTSPASLPKSMVR
jgi:hypothetical protein